MVRALRLLGLVAAGLLPRLAAGEPVPAEPGLAAVAPDPSLCGLRDPSLDRVAQVLVARRLAGRSPPAGRELGELLRAVGAAYVWPSAWAVGPVDRADVALGRLRSWSAARPTEAEPRCGIALRREAKGGWHAAAVRVDAFAALIRLPTEARRHQWIELEAEALAPLDAVTVVLLGPRGRPRRILASTDGQRVRSRFALEQPGHWLVQLVGTSSLGPVPLLEASVAVDAPRQAASPTDPVPGLAGSPSGAGPEEPGPAIGRMLNQARHEEGVPPLRVDAALARLAAAHAAAMSRAGRVGHDVGDGSPAERLEASNLEAQIVGENAAAAACAEDVHRALWASPSHRDNMLDHRYRRVGVGVERDAVGRLWVAQIFAD